MLLSINASSFLSSVYVYPLFSYPLRQQGIYAENRIEQGNSGSDLQKDWHTSRSLSAVKPFWIWKARGWVGLQGDWDTLHGGCVDESRQRTQEEVLMLPKGDCFIAGTFNYIRFFLGSHYQITCCRSRTGDRNSYTDPSLNS